MKGLQGKNEFRREYTAAQMEILQRLAEIEQEDEDRCANCGGEDCICCEYYHDRQNWVSPEELFGMEMQNMIDVNDVHKITVKTEES